MVIRDDQKGCTPLSYAAEGGHKAVVELLLVQQGVNPNSKTTEEGYTPLWYAAQMGLVELLLAQPGIDLDIVVRSVGRLGA